MTTTFGRTSKSVVDTVPGFPLRCAIVLAGGDGQRLRPFVQELRGDSLPKQYVNFVGAGSLMEQTFSRVERLVPPHRIFTVLGREHLSYPGVKRQLSTRSKGTVVVQPHEVYRNMERMNFSNQFLQVLRSHYLSCLWVLPARGVSWSDWGFPRRIERSLKQMQPAGLPMLSVLQNAISRYGKESLRLASESPEVP